MRTSLATLAIWTMAQKSMGKAIDYNDPTFRFLQKNAPKQFEAVMSAPVPTFMRKW